MLCILIVSSMAFRTTECVGAYPTSDRCDAAAVRVARAIKPITNEAVTFNCARRGAATHRD